MNNPFKRGKKQAKSTERGNAGRERRQAGAGSQRRGPNLSLVEGEEQEAGDEREGAVINDRDNSQAVPMREEDKTASRAAHLQQRHKTSAKRRQSKRTKHRPSLETTGSKHNYESRKRQGQPMIRSPDASGLIPTVAAPHVHNGEPDATETPKRKTRSTSLSSLPLHPLPESYPSPTPPSQHQTSPSLSNGSSNGDNSSGRATRRAAASSARSTQESGQDSGCILTSTYASDFSIMLSMAVSSSTSFDWTKKIPTNDRALALVDSAAPSHCSEPANDAQSAKTPARSFIGSLIYYSFPQVKVEQATIRPRFHFPAKFLLEAYDTWKQALESLYSLFRTGECREFYLLASEFEALFSKRNHVYLSRTSPGLRTLLDKNGIKYQQVNLKKEERQRRRRKSDSRKGNNGTQAGSGKIPSGEIHGSSGSDNDDDVDDIDDIASSGTFDPELEQEILALTKDSRRRRRRKFAQVLGSDATSIVIAGQRQIHIFYDVMRSLSFMNKTQRETIQPPLLLSTKPFLNSSSQMVAHKLTRNVTSFVGGEEVQLQAMEIQGPLFGDMVQRLTAALSLKHDDFAVMPLLFKPSIPFGRCVQSVVTHCASESEGHGLSSVPQEETLVPPSFVSIAKATYSVQFEDGMYKTAPAKNKK